MTLVQADSDLEWHGLLIGRGTPFEVVTLTGWDGAPSPRRVTIPRPGRHGSLPGELRAGERIIDAQIQIGHVPLSTAAFRAARDALRAALAWSENPVEEPLIVMLDGIATQASARVINFDLPTEREYDQGYQTAEIQWAASDPRRYSVDLQQSTAGLPDEGESGLAFPLAFPLAFGTTQAGGTIMLVNGGNANAFPVLEVNGPITGPTITDTATGRRLIFADDFEILAGQTLRIDTDTGDVAIGLVNRRYQLTTAQWFTVPPGTTARIRFDAVAGSGTLTGYLRSAYMT